MGSTENMSSTFTGLLETRAGGEAGRDFELRSAKESLAMKGEESPDRVVSGDGAGGDILCAGAKPVTDVSNLRLREGQYTRYSSDSELRTWKFED
jgi:hypothetical protein